MAHDPPQFEVLPPRPGTERPWVLHLPHGGTWIPSRVRRDILLDDAALRHQLLLLTDWGTDRLFDWLPDAGAHALVNRWSRLVVDPERFADDAREPMAAVGQGAVYLRTTDGAPLRDP